MDPAILIGLQLLLGVVNTYFTNGQTPTAEQRQQLLDLETQVKAKLDADLAARAAEAPKAN